MSLKPRFRALWTLVAAACCAVSTIHPEHETDPFFHMSLGRAVLAHASRTVPEPLALPAFSTPAVVPEWLWSVGTWGLYRLGSWTLLVALLAGLAALAALVMNRLLEAWPGLTPGAAAVASGLALGMAIARHRLRPEAASSVLIPGFLLLALHYAGATGRRRWLLGGALVAVEVLWAQIHGSFVLAPAMFLLVAWPTLYRERRDPPSRGAHLATFGLLCAGLLTSAYGLGLFEYVLTHGHGDAVRHIDESKSAALAEFDPALLLARPSGATLALLWLLGGAGMIAVRRLFLRELGLAALGVCLTVNQLRFMGVAAILTAPLAATGATALATLLPAAAARWGRWAGGALGVVALLVGVRGSLTFWGPFGRVGPAESVHPAAAAAFLATLPPGTSVLSAFNAGAPLTFWLDGRIRTYVDSRTPLYFTDTEFAVARDVFYHADSLARALDRYAIGAVVINRNAPVCKKLPPRWVPAVVEAHYTTFVPSGTAPAVAALAPCGPDFVRPDACAAGGAALDEDIARAAALGETPFVGYLRAERLVRCGGPPRDLTALIPSRTDARTYVFQRDALELSYRMQRGDVEGAMETLETSLAGGEARLAADAGPLVARGGLPLPRVRALLEGAAARLDEEAPAELRAALAGVCAAQGDLACAELQAFRAAVRGSPSGLRALEWVQQNGASPRAREDAAGWLVTLRAEAQAAPAPTPAPPPPAGAEGEPGQR